MILSTRRRDNDEDVPGLLPINGWKLATRLGTKVWSFCRDSVTPYWVELMEAHNHRPQHDSSDASYDDDDNDGTSPGVGETTSLSCRMDEVLESFEQVGSYTNAGSQIEQRSCSFKRMHTKEGFRNVCRRSCMMNIQ